ncbi:Hypothetical protein FKW44_023103, partial [Caligus rogercresseyi]
AGRSSPSENDNGRLGLLLGSSGEDEMTEAAKAVMDSQPSSYTTSALRPRGVIMSKSPDCYCEATELTP